MRKALRKKVQKHLEDSGFSILETIVAIGVLSLAVLALLPLSQGGFGAQRVSSSEVTAVYLAQDAFEYLRNIRDAIQLDLGTPFKTVLAPCTAHPCILKTAENSTTIFQTVQPCPSGCPELRYNESDQTYGYRSEWVPTDFIRTIKATNLNDHETLVTVEVAYGNGSGDRSLVLSRVYYDFSQIIHDATNPVVEEEPPQEEEPPPVQAPQNGLVSWWKFDETGGNSVFDGWSTNNGTLIGGPPRAVGVSDRAIAFDGAEDYIDMGSPAAFDNMNTFTWAAWIFPPNLISGAVEGIVAKGIAGAFGTGNQRWAAIDNSSACGGMGCLELTVNRTGTDALAIAQPGTVQTGVWQLVVFTFDPAIGPRLYKNGAPVAYRIAPIAGTGDVMVDDAHPLTVGATLGTRGFFRGSIDEVRIYNRALSASEIMDLYNATKP